MQTEIQTSQKHSARLREEEARATERLLQERTSRLASVEAEHAARLKPLLAKAAGLASSNEQLEKQQLELRTELSGLQSQIMGRREVLSRTERASSTASQALEDRKEAAQVVTDQIRSLHEQIAPLQDTVRELSSQIDTFSYQRDDIRVQLSDAITDLETTSSEKQRLVARLEAKKADLLAEITLFEHDMEIQRAELARRLQAASDKEHVLVQREAKVRRDEQVNLRNTQLINM